MEVGCQAAIDHGSIQKNMAMFTADVLCMGKNRPPQKILGIKLWHNGKIPKKMLSQNDACRVALSSHEMEVHEARMPLGS